MSLDVERSGGDLVAGSVGVPEAKQVKRPSRGRAGRSSMLAGLLVSLVRHRDLKPFLDAALRRVYSERVFVGMRRDLSVPFNPPAPQIPLTLRPMRLDEAAGLLSMTRRRARGHGGTLTRLQLLGLLHADIPHCYGAFTEDDVPCFIEWLFTAADNDRIQTHFGGSLSRLAPDEVLLEHAFTLEEFQGLGVMPYAHARLAEQAAAHGARYVIGYIDRRNNPSLMAAKRAGFVPFQVRTDRWRFFRRTVSYAPWNAKSSRPAAGAPGATTVVPAKSQ